MIFLSLLSVFCLLVQTPAWSDDIGLTIGNHGIRAEIANTPQSREQGLMRRNNLCANCGMLFIFDQADRYSFWMKNTSIPLSIAFIGADGLILNVDEMQANTLDIHTAQGDALYALEMNSGWFARKGIKRGATVKGLEWAPTGHEHFGIEDKKSR